MKTYKAVDIIQWIWKTIYDVDKSKTQIRRDLEHGSIKLNDTKVKVNDVFIVEETKD